MIRHLSFLKKMALVSCLVLLFSFTTWAETKTFKSGSFIINMGVVPQTVANGLRPYGMIYNLLRAQNVPVYWVINQNKIKDGTDFTYNGVAYKGGTFIIDVQNRTSAVDAIISSWVSSGVVGNTTVSPLTVDVTYTINVVPRWTLDATNGKIAEAFLTAAGINNTTFPGAYNWRLVGSLECCDDLYVMPHADPTWATHGRLFSWNKDCLGSIWAGCHAVSALENSINPANSTQQMNFLSKRTNTTTPTPWPNNSVLLWTNHSGGSIPYTTRLATDPVAQFMGTTDAAHLNGSEQIYMPLQGTTARWNPGANIISYDPTQANVSTVQPDLSNAAALVVYGRAFDSLNRGYVMYEAGHNIGGTSSAQVAAQRAFFNFSYLQALPKAPQISMTGITAGTVMAGGTTMTGLSASATSPLPGITYTYQWISSCGGTFSHPSGSTTSFTAPGVGSLTTCNVTCKITDNCGRTSFQTVDVTVTPPPAPPVATSDVINVPNGCNPGAVSINVLSNDTDPQSSPLTFDSLVTITATPSTAGTWSSTVDGTVTFTPASNFSGAATIQYVMHNSLGGTATGNITVNEGTADANGCFPNSVYAVDQEIHASMTDITSSNGILFGADSVATDDHEMTFTTAATASNADADYVNFGTSASNFAVFSLAGLQLRYRDTIAIYWSKGATGTATMTVDVATSASGPWTNAQVYTLSTSGTGAAVATISNFVIPQNVSGITHFRIRTGNSGTTASAVNVWIDGNHIKYLNCVSRVPRAVNDNITILEDLPTVMHVLDNDVDVDGAGLNLREIVSAPSKGHVSINLDNTITYVNNTDVSGLDTFYYKVCDDENYCNTARVIVTITEDDCPAGQYKPISGGGTSTVKVFQSGFSGTNAATANNTTSNFRDNGIKADRATTNDNAKTTLDIGKTTTKRTRGLFYFNLSEIPSNAIIEEALFSLWRTGGTNNYTDSLRIFSLSNSFVENQVTWTIRSTGNNWTNLGGDFNATAINARQVTSTNTRYYWNAAPLVQTWVANSATNYGLIVRSTEAVDMRHSFGTKENTTLSMRPMLSVTYLVPGSCSTIANRAPMATPTNVTTNSTTAVTIPVLNKCTDPDGNTVTLQAAISATNGTAVKSGNHIIFTPTSGFNGVATVTFSITDGTLHDTTKLYIEVTNSAPIANNDFPVPAASNAPQTSDVGLNDADPENATLVYALYQNGKNGTATISGSEITYTPNFGFTGTDTLYYEITESGSGCVQGFKDSAYVVFTVNNQAPSSSAKLGITLPCQPVTINLIDGAVDNEGDALEVNSISALSNPSAGTLTNNNDGTVTFTSTPGFSGTVSFDYTLRDNGEPPLVSSSATVTFNVTVPTNTAPIAGDDLVDTIKTGQIAYWSILDNDSDPNGNVLSLPSITVAAQHGTASILANGLLKYIPNSGYFGVDSVTYQLCDSVYDINCNVSQDLCTTAKAYFYVEPLNTVEGVNDENSTWINTAVSGEVLNNDFDKEGDTPLIFNGYVVNGVAVSSGTITVSGILNDGTPVSNCGTLTIGTNGTYTFTPANGFIGIMRVPYALQDARDNAALDTAVLSITVTPLPDDTNSIIANNDENTSYGNPVYGNVLVNDADPQSHSFNVTAYQYDSDGDGTPDANGTLSSAITVGGVDINGLPVSNAGTMTLTANGTYTFTPSSGFYGRVNMNYSICDNTTPQACTMADITIDVLQDINGPANDAPVAGDDFTVTVKDVAKTGNFIGNDSDPNNNPVSISGVTINPAGSATAIGSTVTTIQGGTVQFYANGTYLYTPPTGYTGSDRVTYTICDVTVVEPQPLCTEATIHMLIAPSAPLPPCDTPMNAAVVYSLDSATFSWTHAAYADSVQLNYRVKNTGSWTRVSVVGESYTIYSLSPSTTYEYYLRSYCTNALADTSIHTTTKEFTTPAKNTVLGVNDENSTWVDVPVSGTILNNDKDPEGDYPITFNGYMVNGVAITSGTFTVSGVDANGSPVTNAGSISIGSNGTYTFTPASSFVGVVSVPYALQDAGTTVAHDTAVLSITVNPLPFVSNSIIANNDENISYGNPVSGNVVLNDADPQADNFSVSSYKYDSDGDGTPDATGTLSSSVSVGGVDADGNAIAVAGTMNLTSNGTYTFTPANGFYGRVNMQYTICDTVTPPACTQATITIDVLEDKNGPSNNPPFAGDDFAVTPKNIPVTGNFSGNDSDPNGDSVSLSGVTINPAGPATPIGSPVATVNGGTVQFYANGTYLYTPATGYTGPDRVAYTICDVTVVEPQPLCAEATIHLLVAETSCSFPMSITTTFPLCHGENGTITLSPTGGTGTISYTVNGTTQSNPYAAPAGNYTVVATDINGCSTSVTTTMYEPDSISFNASANDALCFGGNGSLTFIASGGTGTISYNVNGTTETSPYAATAGTYTIVATDANSCSV
ncbi:MAG: tandem-95 repeat protein, partial [Chitinophagaceae bacterium]|nr:tandem-95 repeat protein [Chitinophagaceae bacterium]